MCDEWFDFLRMSGVRGVMSGVRGVMSGVRGVMSGEW